MSLIGLKVTLTFLSLSQVPSVVIRFHTFLYFEAFLNHQYLVLLPYWKLLETHRKCKFVSLFEILDYLCNCILNRIR